MANRRVPSRPGKIAIFRPYRTLPNGKVLWARQCGKKVFVFWIDKDKAQRP